MAKSNVDRLVAYGIGFGALYTLYGLALNGVFGDGGQYMARKIRDAWGDTPAQVIGLTGQPSSTQQTTGSVQRVSTSGSQSTSTAGWQPTSLVDMGQVPVDYNPATGELKQRSSWVARYAPGYPENRYSSGVFLDSSGAQVIYIGNGQFRDGDGRLVDARAFVQAVI